MTNQIVVALSFCSGAVGLVIGWKLRAYFDAALVKIVWRLIASEAGKVKVLELIGRAIEKARP